MLERFVKWLVGYLYVRIKGNSPERFINLCSARQIQIWDIKKTQEGYGFQILARDFKLLPSVARKTKTRPYIVKRTGFPFHVNRIKPRKGLWVGGILFFALIYVLAAFIWDIQISGQYTYTEEALLKYLRTIGVYSGMRRDKLSCPDIERAIRETYSDIGWVSAELKGSRLLIRIQETNMPSLYETESTPKHLLASRSGTVVSIMTRTGTPMVKAGDKVEKGDILISGIVEIYGDSGEIIKKEAVRADGDVMIQSKTSYYNEIARKYQKKEYTGDEGVTYGISAFSYKIKQLYPLSLLWEKKEESAGCDILVEWMEISLNDTLKLPVKIERRIQKKYRYTDEEYTKEEMEAALQKKFDDYLEKLMEKGVIIGENNVKIVISESFGTISGEFIISEKADKFQKISDDEWRTMESDEYSGNDN